MRSHRLTLRQWNLLVRNVKLADAEYYRIELEPLLRDMPQLDMTKLLRNADLLNLGLFASCFAPESGCFEWKPRVDSDIPEIDVRAMIVGAALADIAHALFSLRYIGLPRWCAVLAKILDREPILLQEKLIIADLKTVDLFLWNLLTARDSLHAPSVLSDDSITRGILDVAGRATSDEERLSAICGTLHLWGWARLDELLAFLVEERVVKTCEAAAKRKDVKLIRLAAGLCALRPVAPPARSCEVIVEGLAALHFPLNVPSQSLALERVRQWIEVAWSL